MRTHPTAVKNQSGQSPGTSLPPRFVTFAAGVFLLLAMAGCSGDGPTQRDVLTGAVVAANVTLIATADEPPSPDEVRSVIALVDSWARSKYPEHSEDRQALAAAAETAIVAWERFEAGEGSDWQAALRALLTAVNERLIEEAEDAE